MSTAESTVQRTGWIGWIRFAAVMLLLNGIFSVIQGIVAIFAPDPYYVVTKGQLFLFDISGWGWWTLITGILLIVTGGMLFTGTGWARVVAVILVILSAIGQLLLIPAQPWWASINIGIDILIIYAITAHGRELRPRP
ncbi:hypothetical protein [Leifsonia sp. NPDC058248]|uniref:DUF7144 family membrane protein n=1 Tax=Leifsonia sp. NPDC058248 TaxID=3346402 RepID=UPI0036DB98D0